MGNLRYGGPLNDNGVRGRVCEPRLVVQHGPMPPPRRSDDERRDPVTKMSVIPGVSQTRARPANGASRRVSTGRGGSRFSGRLVLPVLAMLNQVVDDRGVGERRGVAQASRLVLGDLAQDTAHDLAGAGLG